MKSSETPTPWVDKNGTSWPIAPTSFSEPLKGLIGAAVETKGFTIDDVRQLRESLANIRGMKKRATEGVMYVSMQAEKHDGDKDVFIGAHEVSTLLSELALDLGDLERRIVDRLIDGDRQATKQ